MSQSGRAAPVATLDYGSYLRLGALLEQQVPLSDPPVHDELMFIVVHQACELWFKLMLYELEAARDALLVGRLGAARQPLDRVHAVQRLLLAQFDVIETMDPQEFDAFRRHLGTASGMQSAQVQRIEVLSGARNSRLPREPSAPGEARTRLERQVTQPSLWDAFTAQLAAAFGCDDPAGDGWLVQALQDLAGDRNGRADLWAVARSLVEYDRLAGQWRFRHLQVVEWMIGGQRGTGGTAGLTYLRRRLDDRYFPLLWELPVRW